MLDCIFVIKPHPAISHCFYLFTNIKITVVNIAYKLVCLLSDGILLFFTLIRYYVK